MGTKKKGQKPKKEKKAPIDVVALTPGMSVAKKATTHETGSEVKEPLAKKPKLEWVPPLVLGLSADTKAVLTNIDRDARVTFHGTFWR